MMLLYLFSASLSKKDSLRQSVLVRIEKKIQAEAAKKPQKVERLFVEGTMVIGEEEKVEVIEEIIEEEEEVEEENEKVDYREVFDEVIED